MNIWDSVHRGLEKASHEAGRIARAQRLRVTIDSLSRQINTQQGTLIATAMEVFAAGKLTQSELAPICAELASLHQQLSQAQHELRQLHSQGALPSTPPPASGEPTLYVPPPEYQPYDPTIPIPAPPPPPGAELHTVSSLETVMMGMDTPPPPPVESKQYCATCRTEILPGHAYCQNCGTLIQNSEVSHLPTVRGSAPETPYSADQETIRSEPPSTTDTPVEE